MQFAVAAEWRNAMLCSNSRKKAKVGQDFAIDGTNTSAQARIADM